MTLFSLVVLIVIGLVALWLILEPLQRRTTTDPNAAQRDQLSSQRDQLYAELTTLTDETRRPNLERRAALTLRALDDLPPATTGTPNSNRQKALVGAGVALVLSAVAAFTLIPKGQLLSLNADEASIVQAVLSLPKLKAKAEGSKTNEAKTNEAYLAWGKAAFDSAHYDQAVQAYGNALKLNPRQAIALRRLGILLLTRPQNGGGQDQQVSQKDATQAALLIKTAAQLAPNDPESQLLLGFALARFEQTEKAITALERYRTLDPKGRDADEMITSLRAQQNNSDPALSVYAASCASCHGPMGRGGSLGPSLRVSTLSKTAIKEVISKGRNAMPAFPNVKPSDLSALLDLLEKWQKVP